jgi:hypothetical protein
VDSFISLCDLSVGNVTPGLADRHYKLSRRKDINEKSVKNNFIEVVFAMFMFSLLPFLVNGRYKKTLLQMMFQFPGNKMSKAITWLIFLHLYIIDKYISRGDVACLVRDTTYAALSECHALQLIR